MIAGGSKWRGVPFGMFTAYFDASGEIIQANRLVMAGFIAHADSWVEWEKEWLERLAKDDLTYLHMNELYSWSAAESIVSQRICLRSSNLESHTNSAWLYSTG
jgi:hypothetical protein